MCWQCLMVHVPVLFRCLEDDRSTGHASSHFTLFLCPVLYCLVPVSFGAVDVFITHTVSPLDEASVMHAGQRLVIKATYMLLPLVKPGAGAEEAEDCLHP